MAAPEQLADGAARPLASVDNRVSPAVPKPVARTIVKAATAPVRSPATPPARRRSIIATRRLLPDRAFDAVLARTYLR